MADQAGSLSITSTDSDKQIGSDVTIQGGAELVLFVSGTLAADKVIEVFHKEKINNTLREAKPRHVYRGVNCPTVIIYGPVSTPGTNAQLQFFAKTDDTAALTIPYEIREMPE